MKNVHKESKPEERHDADGKRRGKREKKAGNDSGAPQKSEYKMGTDTAERKFPRTRGVLYSRDDKGNFISVDGCDGDLGYGSHSVPGGRVKNSDAYEAFLEQHQKNNRLHDGVLDESFETDVVHASNDLMLHTGFNLPKSDEAAFDWVKSGDTIELMTGNDGSPTLQATAKEWAPSRAALAAASARFGGRGERSTSFEDEEDDGEDDGPFGLGFDPTLNMDSMIQSPCVVPAAGLDGVDLPSLSLEPAYQGKSNHSHIFAFGAGSTWGVSETSGHTDSWGAPSSSGGNAASFLNLSSEKTWGFGGSLGSARLNGKHTRSTGD